MNRIVVKAALISTVLLLLLNCAPQKPRPAAPVERPARETARMGFAIQAGAFSSAENAARLTDSLRKKGIDAYYFVYKAGLYKVRFGNFPSEQDARKKAEDLVAASVIREFYIIRPAEYSINQEGRGPDYIREEIVRTARGFIGVPYLWGGSSQEGLDCSGFTVAVYRLNGLSLPRSSAEQFAAGLPIDAAQAREGDLVFFNTANDGKVSHVGVYVGGGQFIHAPGRGRTIGTASLQGGYFQKSYAGARRYF